MAQTGYTPIKLYYSATTTNVPLAANLASGELAINTADGKLFYTDSGGVVQVIAWKVTPATAGGTGQTSYTIGDLLYAPTSTTVGKLADVATGNALISGGVGVAPSYGKIGLTTHVSGVLPAVNGGTGQSSFAVGDILFAPTTTTVGSIADVATGNVILSGGVGVAPSYGKVGLTTHVSGTLPVANGGTGVTTSTGSGSNVLSNSPTLVTPALGTPTSIDLTNATNVPAGSVSGVLPVVNGGTGVTTSTGSGSNVLSTSPTITSATLVTPALGTPTSGLLTNATGLPLTTGVTGILPLVNGGTGASTAATARTNLGLGTIATYNAAVANGAATLDSNGTLTPSQVPAGFGPGMVYQGTWNASTNTPTLTSSIGTLGYYYIVSVAGTTTLNGISSWAIGDVVVFNGTVWLKYSAAVSPYLIQSDVGTAPNQVPLNQYLGTMAFQDENSVNIQGGSVTATHSSANITGYQLVANSYPSTPASLILDFANSKTLDPRITFTRASTATYYDGVTSAVAEQNLLLQSQTFGTTWVTTNGTLTTGITDPAGGTTATTLTSTGANATVYETVTLLALPYTVSFYVQRVTGTGTINLTLDGTNFTAITVTGSWARYSATVTPTAGAKTVGIQVVTSGDAINIWGAQLEQRSAVTAYNATTTAAITNYIPVLQTAASGVARLDYNPTTGESLGLLIEESRTNLLTYSADFTNAIWTKTTVSVTGAADIAPDGTQTAGKLVEDTSVAEHRITQTYSATSGTSYTFSVTAKAAERTFLALSSNQPAVDYTYFNLATGAIGTQGSGYTATMTSLGNGWYRCSITYTANATATASVRIHVASANGTINYTGNGYSGIYIWGAQLEAGAFATSYIPTVAATVTRAVDAANITGTNFSSWYNTALGSMYAEWQYLSTTKNNNTTIIGMNTNGNNRWIYIQGTTVTSGIQKAMVAVPTSPVFGSTHTDYVNGSVYSQFFTAVVDAPINSLVIGAANISAANNVTSGWFKRVMYYPQVLTATQLQALTT